MINASIENPAAANEGKAKLVLAISLPANNAPIGGPAIKPSPNAAPIKPIPLARLFSFVISAMLANAGFYTTTLDIQKSQDPRPDIHQIHANLIDINASVLTGHDAILCCETLEHLP